MLYTPAVIAVLYDVHGNLAALDAVLEDARAAGAEQWILGGDYALFGAWPAETVARLRELEPAVWVRGNVDRWAGDPAEAPDDARMQAAIADCRGALGDAVAGELGALPFEAELAGARIVHASPVSDMRSFAPEPDPEDEELLDGTTHAAAAVRPHARPVPPPGRPGASSWSTPARSACRSTATRAPRTR